MDRARPPRTSIDDRLTSMTFTTGHTLRLVARDERGATTSATKVVSCQ
jgi:hypothetical protein